MKYKISTFLILLASVMNAQDSVLLDTTTNNTLLNETLVTAPYWADAQTPVAQSSLATLDINDKHFGQEATYLLAQLPATTVTSDAGNYSGYSYVRLRGIDQSRLNLSLNGVPLNEPEDMGFYFANFTDLLESVDGVQVQRGIGTSKNGAASYVGSIGMSSPSLMKPKGGKVFAGYGSYNTHRIGAEYNMGLQKGIGFYGRISQSHSDGYREHADNNAWSGLVSTGYYGKKDIVRFTALYGRQRNGLAWLGAPVDSIARNPRYNANAKEERDDFQQGQAQLHYTRLISNQTSINACVYDNYSSGNYDFDFNNFAGLPSDGSLYNYDLRANYWGAFANVQHERKNLNMSTGLHFNRYQRQHLGSERSLGELYRNTGYKNEYSAFAKANYQLGKWSIVADMQYRMADFKYKGSVKMDDLSWQFFNPSLGVLYHFNKETQLYYNYGATGREPARNDLFYGYDDLSVDTDGALIFQVLDPERVQDHELGWRKQSNQYRVAANVYYMLFTNEIALNGKFGPTGLPLHTNAAKSMRSGLELEAMYQFSNGFGLRHTAAYSYNRIREEGITFQPVLTPNIIINQEVNYAHKQLKLGVVARYQAESYLDYANTNSLPDFLIFDMWARYSIKSVELGLQLRNLSNQRYYTNGSLDANNQPLYFIQAPFNVMGNVQWRF